MWNDTDVPLAYFITFRSYGTWLHGDERGSVDRFHNRYLSPYLSPSARRKQVSEQRLKFPPVILSAAQRKSVENAIHETCEIREWSLEAMSVRTNHLHTVVAIGESKPERALNAFKANSTRHMRQDGNWRQQHSPWADKGSKKRLWNEQSVARVVDYVLHGQGDELPDFD